MPNAILRPLAARVYQELTSRAAAIVDGTQHLHLPWLRSRGFEAVPYSSAGHFDPEDSLRFAAAMNSYLIEEVQVLLLDNLTDRDKGFRMSVSSDALLRLSLEYGSFNLLLLPQDESFAVLCSSEEFGVVAGPTAFCEMALGESLEDARRVFREFIALSGTPEPLRHFYQDVDRRYRPVDGGESH